MKVLIVYAHQEPKSFNAAMKNLAVAVLKEQGHQVKVSDLYAMNFKAVADTEDFLELANPDFFRYQYEQAFAYDKNLFFSDIVAEQEKLIWADFVIFQFPLWWFSLPAILKGWVDRVLAVGFSYSAGNLYNNGGLKGRKAMLALTTGGGANMYSPRGINGDINQILFPIHYGILYFVGMQVLPPFVAYAPAYMGEEICQQYLEDYKQRLLSLATTPIIPFRPLSDYDFEFKLKPEWELKE